MRTVKYFIVLLLLLLTNMTWAQDAASIDAWEVKPTESVEPDAMPAQAAPQKVLAETEEMSMAPLPASTTHVAQVVESRNQVVLLVGDSMADGLGTRFNDYAVKNGFEFHSIVWYGSTTRDWAIAADLQYQIEKVRPTYIIISLGTNDLGYKDYGRRETAIQTILSRVGNIPYVWVGPLPWQKVKDRTIVNVIRDCTGERRFFDSSSVIASRADGIHPTRQGAALWVDKIVEWMGEPELNANPIEMDKPDFSTHFTHDEKHRMGYHGRR
ncbi:SGNH/GDSL hydrolase family protein [Prevotella fusca]